MGEEMNIGDKVEVYVKMTKTKGKLHCCSPMTITDVKKYSSNFTFYEAVDEDNKPFILDDGKFWLRKCN